MRWPAFFYLFKNIKIVAIVFELSLEHCGKLPIFAKT